MIINMRERASDEQIQHIIDRVKEAGFQAHITRGSERTIVAAVGSGGRRHELEALAAAAGVEEVVPIAQPFKLVSRQVKPQRSVVDVAGVHIGDGSFVVIAGPCSVESEEQLFSTAKAVKAAGAKLLRGGAYKPRTSPYEFQGLGVEALKLLRQVREKFGLPVVTEVMGTEDVEVICEHADMLQVGARNMQNFNLLRRLAKVDKPILLKRGPSASVKEKPSSSAITVCVSPCHVRTSLVPGLMRRPIMAASKVPADAAAAMPRRRCFVGSDRPPCALACIW